LINVLKLVSKKLLYAILVFVIFVYITVLLCTIPSNFTVSFEDGRLTFSNIGFFVIKDTNEKFISLIKLDLGRTGTDGRSLNYLVTDAMKNSIFLLAGGLILAILLGIPKGIFDSKRSSEKRLDLKVLSTIIPVSLPDIMIIALLQRLAVFLNTHGIEIFRVGGGGTIKHLLLPLVALSVLPACYIARITSMSIDDCYNQDFINVAIGKGCSNFRILWNHVMRNALPMIIGSLPSITAIVIGNLLIVESVFGYPGLTNALVGFFMKYERDGLIACIILIGIIYFILDSIFHILKWTVYKPHKERIL
jgi:ABC-type dipeptide/oligopeptide/nickel transport system permease component